MDGFRTARALVLDNDRNEAAPVIEALGSLGVGVLFHTGDNVENLKAKHRGIRLLIVDMVLENRGASSDDPNQCVSTLVSVLEALLQDDHHPVVIVCWTKHTEFKTAFEEAFRKTFPKYRFDEVILFAKEDLLDKSDELLKRVQEALIRTEPFSLLLDWEQHVHDAATDTTSQISRLISERLGTDSNWGQLAYRVCAALVVAERGFRVGNEDGATAAAALLSSLTPILIDRLEVSGWEKRPAVLNCHETLMTAAKEELLSLSKGKNRKSLLPEGIPAALNTIVHCVPYNKTGEAAPGAIWAVPKDTDAAAKHGFSALGVEWDRFKEEIFAKPSEANVTPVFVEVTPACDFAQDKASVARLVAGFLVMPGAKPLPRIGHLWDLSPLLVVCDEGGGACECSLVLSAKYFVTTTRNATAGWPPIYRLRQAAVVNLAYFVANHISRIGLMKIQS